MTTTRTAAQVRTELQALRVQAQRYDRLFNEGGEGYNPHAAAIRTLEAELVILGAAEYKAARAAELASWTAAVTQERRAAWNTWVQDGKRTPTEMTTWLRQQGWTLEDLKAAITRHGL